MPDNRRRDIRFEALDEVFPDAATLARGHRTVGVWSLGQICKHLADSFHGSIDGFDLSNHRIKRLFLKRVMLNEVLTKGIRPNYTVDPAITPPVGVELLPVMEELGGAIKRYRDHVGELKAHPLFGCMARDVWDRVHCVHCAHHLSFAIPGESDRG